MRHEVEPHIKRHGRLENNINFQAYRDIQDLLEASYGGQWVAFYGGELIAVEPDRETLFSKARAIAGRGGFFYHEIGAEPIDLGGPLEVGKRRHFRSPHRVRK